jgi:hypothetical protein
MTRAFSGEFDVAKQFIATIDNRGRREGALLLLDLMMRVTGERSVVTGSVIGFGHYHYRYESGRKGDSSLVASAP